MDKTDLPDLIRGFIDLVDGHIYQAGNYLRYSEEVISLTREGLRGPGMDDMQSEREDFLAEVQEGQRIACNGAKKLAALIDPSEAARRDLLAFCITVDAEDDPTSNGFDAVRTAWKTLKQELKVLVLQGAMPANSPKSEGELLTDTQTEVADWIRNAGRPVSGKEIVNALMLSSESTLTSRIIPALKRRGLKNRRGAGYYFPSAD